MSESRILCKTCYYQNELSEWCKYFMGEMKAIACWKYCYSEMQMKPAPCSTCGGTGFFNTLNFKTSERDRLMKCPDCY